MKLQKVKSRMISWVRYNENHRTLDVIFTTGHMYRYKKVPMSKYEGLLKAESKGQYMHQNILNNYEFEQIFKPVNS